MNWLEEVDGYGNGHETFHIVQNGLSKEDVSKAISIIIGEDIFVGDGKLTQEGACFSTAKEDIVYVTEQLSKIFPNAVCFGQDEWEHEGYIICYENGHPSDNYKARFSLVDPAWENGYYEVCADIFSGGYSFTASGGMVSLEEVISLWRFINHEH